MVPTPACGWVRGGYSSLEPEGGQFIVVVGGLSLLLEACGGGVISVSQGRDSGHPSLEVVGAMLRGWLYPCASAWVCMRGYTWGGGLPGCAVA